LISPPIRILRQLFSKCISISLSSINQSGKKYVAFPHKNRCPLLRHSMRFSHSYAAKKLNVVINLFKMFAGCLYCSKISTVLHDLSIAAFVFIKY